MKRATAGRLVAVVALLVALVAAVVADAQTVGDACRTVYGERSYTAKSETARTKGDTVTVSIRCQWVTK